AVLCSFYHVLILLYLVLFVTPVLGVQSRKPIAIIVSFSKDGDLISGVIKLLGWHPVRGSSSKGGAKALRKINEAVKAGYSLGHIVDGPKGPVGEVKPGLMLIAKTSGMPVFPTIISAEKKWIFNSWDRFILPRPFSRIIIRFDKEISIPKKAGNKSLETIRMELQERLFRLYNEIDEYW
ncbi:MAG: lysophospholipid acyltransferase family protein, partial [Spirochaetes bacterium]|nr:lysophospholipid acyltransferase family protein [Spirochaetota bacterium]